MQKLSLSINERINLIQLPPKEGDYLEQLVWAGILRKTKVGIDQLKDMPRDIYNGIDEEASEKASVEFEFESAEIDAFKTGCDKIKTDKKVNQAIVFIIKKVMELPTDAEKKKTERVEAGMEVKK